MPIKHSGTGTTAVGSCSCSYSLFTLLKTHRSLFTVTFLALFAMVFLCHLYISPIMFTPTPSHTDPYHTLFLSLASNYTAAHHLRALTAHPHIAGSGANSDLAIYVSGVLSSHSFHTHFSIHSVLLSRPLSRSLTLSLPNPSHDRHSPPTFSFALTQRTYSHDPYADQASEVAPTFHAFAKSGTAVGAVVYVNYGRVEDYQSLREKGVDVSGAIVLARYGKIYRGDIVRNADTAGAVGVVVYTDRTDYGGGGSGIGFPLGKWMPESGVQMGMVYMGVGDPTTPGWGSRVGGCERLSEEEMEKMGVFPRIPSLPVSMQDGEMILKEIGGPEADEAWQGGGGGGGGGEEMVYRLGPGPAFLNLSYYGKNEFKNIQNVFGVIEGEEEPDRYILLGNHRDAWAFGAADPNSGTAALLEIAERFHKLQKKGWKPRRTIMFCNWDAEEYGMIGSTEWVEGNKELITSKVVAYLNVDVAVAGSGFNAAATPQLDDLIKEATRKVQDPDNSSRTLYESWTVTAGSPPLVERLGRSGSDHVSFVHHVGIPSSDIYFGQDYPVYHSMFDDFVWMEKYGDPMFHRHAAAASVWGLVALKLADEEFLPFNYLSYVSELLASTKELEDYLSQTPISVVPIYHSIEELKKAANKISADKKALERNSSPLKWRNNPLKVRELNDRLMMAERAFTDQEGLVGRIWYKNLIYGPSFNDDYGSKSFPGVNAAIKKAKKENTKETWRSVQHEVWRVSRVIAQVSFVLRGEFS